MCHEVPNAEADSVVVEIIEAGSRPVRIEAVVQESGIFPAIAWQAIMRMIGAGRIGAERDTVINYPSEIWSARK